MSFIVSCDCGDTQKFALDAFRLLFPNAEPPELVSVETALATVAEPQWERQLQALQRTDQKFAYLFREEEVWDLMKGVRIA